MSKKLKPTLNNRGMYIGKNSTDLSYGQFCIVVKKSNDNRKVAIQPENQNKIVVINRFDFLLLNNITDYQLKNK